MKSSFYYIKKYTFAFLHMGLRTAILVFVATSVFLLGMLFLRGWQIYSGEGVSPYEQELVDQAGMMLGGF